MKIIKINNATIYLLFILFICGYIKIGLICFLIVLIHELGHVLVCVIFKYKIIKIDIYPFGGITRVEKDINTSPINELILASGGLLMQVILFIIISNIDFYDKYLFLKYNKSIFLFNLICIIPLDGSKILYSILNIFMSFKKTYKLYIIISIVSLVIYIVINYKYSLNNYLIISIFIYKIYECIKNYKYVYNRFLLERYINNYRFKYINTSKGDLGILKLDTYQYFLNDGKIVGERQKLKERFDKRESF